MADKTRVVRPERRCPAAARPVVPVRPLPPRWLRLPTDPSLVQLAREHALAALAEAQIADERHHEDVRLVVSEVVTNAMRAAERYAGTRGRPWAEYERPVGLRVVCRPRWTHLLVIDPDPEMPEPAARDVLDESGRGLTIVDSIAAASWPVSGAYGKTVHAVIAYPGVEVTRAEVQMLKARVIL